MEVEEKESPQRRQGWPMSTVSTDLNSVKAARYMDQESKRYNAEVKKLRQENAQDYHKQASTYEHQMQSMKQDFEKRISQLNSELERKLLEVRDSNERKVKEENQRLEAEVRNLKSAHQDQVVEIRLGHQNEIEKMNESHRTTLNNAKNKFVQEKQKWEV